MEVKDRAAYESLRRKYDYLTTALQPADILPSLFASGLISIVQMQEIELAIHERGPGQGSSKLLSTLMSNGSEGAFKKFLDVLRNKSHLRYLVPELQSEYERQQSSLLEQTREQQVTTGLFSPHSTLTDPNGRPPTSEPAIETTLPHQPTPPHTVPLDKQSVRQYVKQLESRFSNLVYYTYLLLTDKGIETHHFHACLMALDLSRSKEHGEFIDSLFKSGTTIGNLWCKLRMYWNFLNFYLLEHIINRFGNSDLKHQMNSYVCDLQKFRSATRLCDFIDCWPVVGETPPTSDLRTFVVKMKLDWDTCTLEDLETFKGVITHKLFLPDFTLRLEKIEDGCITVTWLVPAPFVKPSLEAIHSTTVEFFMEQKIDTISIDGYDCYPFSITEVSGHLKEHDTSENPSVGVSTPRPSPSGTAPTSQDAVVPRITEEEAPMVEIGVTDLQGGSYHFSQQVEAPSLLQRSLPRALPGLEEVKVESLKERTQYESREFKDPPQLPQGQGFHIVTYNILSYLDDARSLCRAEQVCNDWYQVICKELLWKKLIEKKVKTDSMWRGLSERRGWKKYLFHLTPSEEVMHQFYKQLYTNIIRDIDILQLNWMKGHYKLTRIECHSKKDKEGVYYLQYDDNKIVSGHRDSTIKIWDRISLSVTTELRGHTGRVRCLQYDDRVIVTGSHDSTIRVWDVKDHSLVNRLDHHSDAVMSLKFNSDTLVTGSADHTVAVWDMISPMDIFMRTVLKGHTASVSAVDFDEKYIVSGSEDKTINVWQTSTGELVHTLHGHRDVIWCLQYRGKHIVSGSLDRTIRIWDIERGACLRILEGHSGCIWSIRFDDKRIVSGGFGVINVWDFQAALDPRSQADTLCLQTLREHSTVVYGLQFDDFQIVSGSYDDSILIWDFLDAVQPGYMQSDQ